ncbi:MAG: hypothetical protein NVS1B2_24100 [Vulcanimicrobiaceae bacterium]
METPHPPHADRHLVLHEERLDVVTERETLGLASVGTEVATEPIVLEVAFASERADVWQEVLADGTRRLAHPIDEPQRLVVRLSKERLDVRKATVVVEEVTVGLRERVETLHVREVLEREHLDVRRDVASDEESR